MMEEVSDDTNGDSTFEFLGDTPSSTAMVIPSAPTLTTGVQIVPSTPANPMMLPSPAPIPIIPPPPMPTSPPSTANPMPIDIPPPQPMPTFTPIPQDIITPLPKPIAYQGFQQTSTTSSPLSGPICSAPQPFFVNPPITPSSATVDLSMADPYQTMPQFQQSRGDPSGVWGWFRGSEILNKVAEKAKNSMESMITTLDPGMKEYIYSGGNVDVVVASDDEEREVSPVREAFQATFGRATVSGIPSRPQSVAIQPMGFPAALQGAEEKISLLRHGGQVHEQQAILAIQNFLVELTPDRWFEMSCLLLQDPTISASLQTYTQPLSVPHECVLQAQEQTPSDYPLRWSGLAVPVNRGFGSGGVSNRELLLMASKALGDMYRLRLQQQYI